jgi:carboxypeptidase family protein
MRSQHPTSDGINRKVQRLIFLILTLLFPCFLFAQSFRGSIRGQVVDPNGNVIVGAKVSAKNSGTSQVRETVTAEDGSYVLAELPAGEYVVVAEYSGLSPVGQNVIVNVGSDTTANFDLTRVEKRLEQLTVTEEAPVIDTTRDVLNEVVDQRLVAELPLNGRDFGKLVALSPGATVDPSGVAGTQGGFGQFNINGNRDRSNNYMLDGTDNNDPFFNNSALNQTGIGGAPASLLPIDAIQEFNLQSQFGAEYGRNSGSVVNIVTRSGTNKLHGSAFEFFRNSALDARNYFNSDPQKSVFQNSNFGASLGGPIVKDKTFFFGAYEGQREQVGSDFLLLVPTQAQIQQARTGCHSRVLSQEQYQRDSRRCARQKRRRQLHRKNRREPHGHRTAYRPLRLQPEQSDFPFWLAWRIRRRIAVASVRPNVAHPRAGGFGQPAVELESFEDQ